MADPFVAEIRIFPFYFAPTGWAFCNGQILPISQNTALFSLLGTTYGGDGKSTFALPDLQGSAAMHPGQGQGLSLRDLGEIGGAQYVTLLQTEMPAHSHTLSASLGEATERAPAGQMPASGVGVGLFSVSSANSMMAFEGLAPAGGSMPHNNMQPYLTLNFCIALQGVYPSRG
ncbi:phage tail protein [Deinococcus misasensis]|uniref:phage tail protein n=1 Tax=Deinococcus misasensis TaxID=392413 RepID=UPI000550BD4F|nr:tail fiber protein [Deinococcus misasensis]